MRDVNSLVGTMFSGLSALVVEDVADGGEVILVSARTRGGPMPCPACGMPTGKVHGFHTRTLADVPVTSGGSGSRSGCGVWCARCWTVRGGLREQAPGVVERHQRRTNRLAAQLGAVVKELAGRAGARISRFLAFPVSRSSALRTLTALPVPAVRVPRVIGIDDFALKRRHRYATVIIDAETGERIDVLPERTLDTVAAWLRNHTGADYVCRDGSGSHGEAIRQALPEAVQVSDRWLCGRTSARRPTPRSGPTRRAGPPQ